MVSKIMKKSFYFTVPERCRLSNANEALRVAISYSKSTNILTVDVEKASSIRLTLLPARQICSPCGPPWPIHGQMASFLNLRHPPACPGTQAFYTGSILTSRHEHEKFRILRERGPEGDRDACDRDLPNSPVDGKDLSEAGKWLSIKSLFP